MEATFKLADIFIGNEVECKQMETILGYGHEKLLDRGVKAIIETKGGSGSVIYETGKTTRIPARKVSKVIEATGAGDAYRAGLIYGILEGTDLATACRIGSYLGAKSVEMRGAQTYSLSPRDIKLFK